ncbi:TPA: hypothetical protein HA265_00205, partial [Candidatus Woesearchaeota archaeon]|nr:hypothetical protein [Candidatus Woesearchaeota archaeon]
MQQIPADLSNTNLFSSLLNITYNITDPVGLNESTIRLYYKTNTSDSECWIYVNGSSTCGYQPKTYSSKSGTLYSFRLSESEIYPAVYNFNQTVMVNTAHQSFSLVSNKSYMKVRFFNITNSKPYFMFEVFANASASSGPLRVYYCNSSYAFGDPVTSANCINFYNLDATVAFNHSHSSYSRHQLIPLAINTTTKMVGDKVYMSPVSYFLLRGRDGSDWKVYYIPQVARKDTVQNISVGTGSVLRPNALGSASNLGRFCFPSCSANWQAVDDINSDGDITYVRGPSDSFAYDLYNVPDITQSSSVITKVTVYIFARASAQCAGLCQARTKLRTNSVIYDGPTISLTGTTYATYATEYSKNPQTGLPWTVSEVNNMQIGVGLKSRLDQIDYRALATQVYAVVDKAVYNNFTGTVDAHLHQYDGSTFYYYTCAKDNSGTQNCSPVRSDPLQLGGLPPIAPQVYAPVTGYYSGYLPINFTKSASPNAYTITNYNISLVDNTLAFVQTIRQYNGANLSYLWDSSSAADGLYRAEVEACDSQGQCSSGRSPLFTIDNTDPGVDFASPTETSGSTVNRDYIYVNVTATDTNFDRIRILLYNTTGLIRVASLFSSPSFWNFTNVTNGVYYFNATAIDKANNSNSTVTRNVTVNVPDTAPPASVTNLKSDFVNTTAVDWSWVLPVDADFNSTIVYLNGTNVVNTTNAYYNATGLACGTVYNLTLHTKDHAGNVNLTDVTNLTSTTACPDTTPPASVTN